MKLAVTALLLIASFLCNGCMLAAGSGIAAAAGLAASGLSSRPRVQSASPEDMQRLSETQKRLEQIRNADKPPAPQETEQNDLDKLDPEN